MPVAEEKKLRIAFTFDSKAEWLALGYSEEECAEFNSDKEIDDVAGALRSLGYEVDMVGNIKSLAKRFASSGHNWDLVFNVCEGPNGYVGREAYVPGLLEAWGIDYTFSDCATLALCLDKCKTKMVLDYFKVPTAPYAVVQNNTRLLPENPHHSRRAALSIASSPYASSLSAFPLFIKPCAEGTGKGITPSSKITNPSELETVTRDLCERFPGQDILIEPFLVGREHTVGIVGTGDEAIVIGITEASFTAPEDAEHLENPGFLTYETKTDVYSRVDIRPCSLDDPVIREVADVSVRAWKALGCRDGGRVDVRLDGHGPEAKAYVMEVNPLAGLSRGYSAMSVLADMSYEDLIKSMVDSALKRVDNKDR